MKIKQLLTVCALGIASASGAVTIEECQQLAQNNYPLLSQYGITDEMSALSLDNIKKGWLPQIQLSAQATYQSDVTNYPDDLKKMFSSVIDMKGLNRDQYKVALDVNQTIWDGGKMKAEREINENSRIADSKQTDVKMHQLRATVRELYFGILTIDETRKQNALQLSLLNSNRERVLSYVRNGVAMEADADAVYAQILTVRQQDNRLSAMRRQYSRALGIFIGEDTDSIAAVMPDELTVSSAINRPELQSYDAQISLIDSRRRLLDAALMPRFNAFATGFYGNPGLNMFDDMVSPHWSWNYIVGVSMKWNIGSLYTRKNDMKTLALQKQQVETARQVFLFNNNIESRQKEDEISRNRQLVADDNEIIAVRTRIRKAAESKLNNGVIDVTDLLQKITDENLALVAQSSHRIQLLKSIYEHQDINN